MNSAPPAAADISPAKAGAAALRAWMVEKALPLWSASGFDVGQGVFQERLDWSGGPISTVPRRAMVQARQIYVFAHAAHLGWRPEGGRLAELAMWSLLRRFCGSDGPSGGFDFSISPEGRVVSSVRDAYTHAFVLFAIAWLYRLNGERKLLDHADRTIAFIDRVLEDQALGGLFDRAPVEDRTKRQNPHMHLLEAYLALEAAAPSRGYLERAEKLINLFKTRLFLDDPGVLLEYFGEDWGPHPDVAKRGVFEPGHHFEWIWLLREYEALSGADTRRWILELDRTARQNGLADNGMIFDEVKTDFSVLKNSHRIWPHTEGAKAAVARVSMGDAAAPAFASAMIRALFETFLDKPFVGGWIDHVDAEGRPLVDYAPASSLYHLFLAAAETSRAFPSGSAI